MRTAPPGRSDKVKGLLLGLAAGDQNGGPIRMALRLAESLSDRRAFDPQDVLSRYLDWYCSGAFDTGPVASRVFALITKGTVPEDAVKMVHSDLKGMTAGGNPAHRCGPLSMARFIDDEALPSAAAREALLTHYDQIAGDVSAAVVVLCRQLILGSDWRKALELASVGRPEKTRRALRVAKRNEIDPGGFSPNILAAAVYFLEKHDSLAGALDESFEFAGGANYCPVLVGAIGGARWGVREVPINRISHQDILPRIYTAAERLASGW